MNEIIINNLNGNLTVSSTQVARDFEKRHDHVTRDIDDLINQITSASHSPILGSENFTTQNYAVKSLFIESSYVNERGRTYKCYELTRDGFSLLVMGFTGRKALEWKLKYIEAFNLMEEKLHNQYGNLEEIITKAVTAAVSETVKVLMPLLTAPQVQNVNHTVTYSEPTKHIRKRYKHVTPSKISTLSPELKRQVDEMIASGEYSCQQVANYITNNSGIEISQMAVNRYKRNNFSVVLEEEIQLSLFQEV